MAGPFESFAAAQHNPLSHAGHAIADQIQQVHAHALAEDLISRDRLVKQFEAIEQDNTYDQQARNAARDYAFQLKFLRPTDKLPKHFEIGKDGRVPALVDVTYRKVMKDGPSEPPQPAEPPEPSLEPPPDVMGGMAGAPSAPSQPGIPPMPGGQQPMPGKISPSPAIPGLPAPPYAGPAAAAPAPAPPSLPPPPDVMSTRMDPVQMARQEARIANIKNAIPDDIADAIGVPKGTPIKVVQEMRLRSKQASDAAMNESKAELAKAQALREQASIETDKVKADALGKTADAHMLAAQAAMERAHNNPSMLSVVPIVDAQGNLTGTYGAPKTPGYTPAQVPEGSRKTAESPTSIDRRAALNTTLTNLDQLESLGERFKDHIGAISGRLTDLQRKTIGVDGDVNELFRLSDDMADLLLRARSGAQINEQEYARLRPLVPDPRGPYTKFVSDLKGYRREAKLMLEERKKAAASPASPASPAADQPNALPPPPDKRMTGKTTWTDQQGVLRVWNGTGWAKVKQQPVAAAK